MFAKGNLEVDKWVSGSVYDVIVKTTGNKSKYT